jgi:hypothetical protein
VASKTKAKRKRKKKKKKGSSFWIEGSILNEETGIMETIKYKVKEE